MPDAMKKRTIILIHILFWFYIVNQSLFPMYVGKLGEVNVIGYQYIRDVLITLVANAVAFYAFYCVFPGLYSIRNKGLIAALSLLTVFVVTGIRYLCNAGLLQLFDYFQGKAMGFTWMWYWSEMRASVIMGIYAVLIRFLIRSFEIQKLKDELTNQRQAGELTLLKAKVNPHFLFNTLNNIYSLVIKKSDEAPDAVMKFSAIMRYVLSETNNDFISLDKEVEYLKNFIELHKLRLIQAGSIELNVTGVTENIQIAPMLLIPFVENAFKHGSKNHHPGIFINLHAEKKTISFEVINYLKEHSQQVEKASGVSGLPGIRRRLELTYPGKHELKVTIGEGMYKVNLIIHQ